MSRKSLEATTIIKSAGKAATFYLFFYFFLPNPLPLPPGPMFSKTLKYWWHGLEVSLLCYRGSHVGGNIIMDAYVCSVNYKNHTFSPREGYLTLAFGPWVGNLTWKEGKMSNPPGYMYALPPYHEAKHWLMHFLAERCALVKSDKKGMHFLEEQENKKTPANDIWSEDFHPHCLHFEKHNHDILKLSLLSLPCSQPGQISLWQGTSLRK